MKLVSLNLWGGKQGQVLFDFLKRQAGDADIFCFQEVFDSSGDFFDYQGFHPHFLEELQELLPDFKGYFAPAYRGWIATKRVDFPLAEGRAIFVKKGHKVKTSGSVYIYGEEQTQIKEDFTNAPENLQYVQLNLGSKNLLVVNVHGMWHPGDKLDTPDRLKQSEKIMEFVKKYPGPKIVCGDFNLMPETQSIKLLEKIFANLIKTYNITNTRNKISWDMYRNRQHFADYTFVSPEIKVKNFEVPYNEVSDHLPMILEFSL